MSFFNIYDQGFFRVSVGVPTVKVGDPFFNAGKIISLIEKAYREKAGLVIFPELSISSYSLEDLHHQEALLRASLEGLERVLEASKGKNLVVIVGAPLKFHGMVFNCAVSILDGKILAIYPKTYLPNYREFYEKRHFASSEDAWFSEVELLGKKVPFGNNIILNLTENVKVFVELCEDLWTPIPPSSLASLAGATIICNLSASNITVGKEDYRRLLVQSQSAKTVTAYLYSASGYGESTTDLAWDGHAIIAENGDILAHSRRFLYEDQIIFADIDLDRLIQDRIRLTSFRDCGRTFKDRIATFREIEVPFTPPHETRLKREIPRFPFVPHDPVKRDKRCFEVYNIQVQGLIKRLDATGLKRVVIGVSGGLDSTHALIVCARSMDIMGLPRKNVLAYTMPGFATSRRTFRNAKRLMEALGVDANEIDIREICRKMLKDIGHPFGEGKEVFDVTFENVQAGMRTAYLFRIANFRDALVVGTGDLSELALGWCTFGVGDHMSHYNVNASVPKTLIQYLIRWVVEKGFFKEEVNKTLIDILNTEISPELVPGREDEEPHQKTESIIGPYELHDFFLYYTLRFGYRPSKVAFLAYHAWKDKEKGLWPDVPPEKRREYSLKEIKKWLSLFLYRFFKLSQYKRSTLPNGPKVGSGGSLSPRGDYRAPSDAEDAPWQRDLQEIPEE